MIPSLSVYISLWALLLGVIIGSFLNVCIYRLPQRLSVVTPRSHCPQCGRFVPWYDNIPLLSYLLLRGRCRSCKKHISLRYPLVEALAGVLSALVVLKFGINWAYVFYFLLLAAPLIVVAFIDLEHRIIPDAITLPGIAIGGLSVLVLSGLSPVAALLKSLWGILAGGGSLLLIAWLYQALRKHEGLGGGDIKLAAMLGAFFGWKGVVVILFLASLLGSLTGIVLLIARRGQGTTPIPFGPFLAAGALIQLFVGSELLHWYLNATYKLY